MGKLTNNNEPKVGAIPHFFEQLEIKAPIAQKWPKEFDWLSHCFALADEKTFSYFQEYAIEANIEKELALMDENSCLEITLPTVGIADLAQQFESSSLVVQLATVLGINGLGAKPTDSLTTNHPAYPDFMVVTDIVGNRYEILLNAQGEIELPQEGTGLFTFISAITFIYSSQQIKEGRDLEDLQKVGVKPNHLYLLAPRGAKEEYAPVISVAQMEQNKRVIKSIRKLKIHCQIDFVQDSLLIEEHLAKDLNLLQVNICLNKWSCTKPFALTLSLKADEEVKEAAKIQSRSWLQPIARDTYIKYFGLSYHNLSYLAAQLYSQTDLMREYLQGKFSFYQQRGYNDFLLRTQGFSIFYQLLIKSLCSEPFARGFLSERVCYEKWLKLDLTNQTADYHDNRVLTQLKWEIADYHLDKLFNIFPSHAPVERDEFLIALEKSQPLHVEINLIDQKVEAVKNTSEPLSYQSSLRNKVDFTSPLDKLSKEIPHLLQAIYLNEVMDFTDLSVACQSASPSWLDFGLLLEAQEEHPPSFRPTYLPERLFCPVEQSTSFLP